MKWLLTVVMVIGLLVAGNARAMNVWALYEDSGFAARLGTGDKIEIGTEFKALMNWTYPFQDADYLGGIYGVWKFGNDDAFLNPYIGGRILFDYEINDWPSVGGPVAGIVLSDFIVVEYQNQHWSGELDRLRIDEHLITAGVRLKF